MTPAEQAIHDVEMGDCMRAAIATLLDLPSDSVPHFLRHGHLWFYVMTSFLWSVGWEYHGSGYPDRRGLQEKDSYDGFFYATVKSRNFENVTHAVVIDATGIVVHDPSPLKKHQGANVIESGELVAWHLVTRRTDDEWKSWCDKGARA